MHKDIELVYEIFSQSRWENIYQFKNDIDKISDKKLATGLLVEFLREGFSYGIDKEYIFEMIKNISDDNDFLDSNDYYITMLKKDVRTTIFNFLQNDSIESIESINWIKKLTNEEYIIIEKYFIKNEYYEILSFVKKNRN